MSPAEGLPLGSYAVDLRSGRVGEVMGRLGPYLLLRPLGGGREWECSPGRVCTATAKERLKAKLSAANAESSNGRWGR